MNVRTTAYVLFFCLGFIPMIGQDVISVNQCFITQENLDNGRPFNDAFGRTTVENYYIIESTIADCTIDWLVQYEYVDTCYREYYGPDTAYFRYIDPLPAFFTEVAAGGNCLDGLQIEAFLNDTVGCFASSYWLYHFKPKLSLI